MSKPYRTTPHISTMREQTVQANNVARKVSAHSRGEYCDDLSCQRCTTKINHRLTMAEDRRFKQVRAVMSERVSVNMG